MGAICQLTVLLSIRNFAGTGEFEQKLTKETKGVVGLTGRRPEFSVFSFQRDENCVAKGGQKTFGKKSGFFRVYQCIPWFNTAAQTLLVSA